MKRTNLPPALRVVLCMVLLLVAYVLQRTLGVRLTIFGVHIDLLPLIVAAAAVLMGSGAGIVCGRIGEYFHNRQIVGTMLCSAGMVLALAAIRYLFLFQFSDMGILVFARSMAVQLLLAVVLSPAVLVVVRRVSGNRKGISPAQTMEGGSNGPA